MPALRQQVRRGQYVATLWCAAGTTDPTRHLDPLNYGWQLVNGLFSPKWFEGECLPAALFVADDQSSVEEDVIDDDEPWSEDSESDSDQ